MNIQELLNDAQIDRLDAEIILAHVLRKKRDWLIAHGEEVLDKDQIVQFQGLVERRRNGEPIAYIVGRQEFYGRSFMVTEETLIPRPSTEGLIDLTLSFLRTGKEERLTVDTNIVVCSKKYDDLSEIKTIVDIGTGSGCIGITLALECAMSIIATDISPNTLSIARQNAEKHHVEDKITLLQGNLLEPIKDLNKPFIVVSNPPYIPQNEELMPDVYDFEPHAALFGGSIGDEIVKELVKQSREHPYCKGIVIEARSEQFHCMDDNRKATISA